MNSAKNVKNALRSEAGDGERPGRTPVGGANAGMVNPGGDLPGPIKKTGSKENIKCVLKKNLKHIQIIKILFVYTLVLYFELFRIEKLEHKILKMNSRVKIDLTTLEEVKNKQTNLLTMQIVTNNKIIFERPFEIKRFNVEIIQSILEKFLSLNEKNISQSKDKQVRIRLSYYLGTLISADQ